jgi:IclR family acetate operon transcriptional repressor
LIGLGYVRQEPSRQYTVGTSLLLLAQGVSTLLSVTARPYLSRIVGALGETANLAMLDGDGVVYVAQAQSQHSMRMSTQVGHRILPHCSAVGKALMASMPESQVRERLVRSGMPPYTERTIVDPDEFIWALRRTAKQGYATGDGEHEVGVSCVAVALPNVNQRLAMSISAPSPRLTADLVRRAVPVLTSAASALADELALPNLAKSR